MKRPSIKMSCEEYEVLEHPFGWKVEYWNGHAHFTPRAMCVETTLDISTLNLSQQPKTNQHTLIPIDESFTEQMVDGYIDAFNDSVEFCNWPIKSIIESAQRDIYHYFSEKKGKPLPASILALEPNTNRLAGLALFMRKPEQPSHMDLLYVRAPFRKQGIATAMLHHGINQLKQSNYHTLSSSYHVCNHQSQQWHHKNGFQDIYDPFYTRIKLGSLRNEIRRRKKLGMLEELAKLKKEQEQWERRKTLDDARRDLKYASILKSQ